MPDAKKCEIKEDGERLVIKSFDFRPERGSILHSGIYGRELASSLSAGAAALLLALALNMKFGIMNMAVLLAVFGALFIVSMVFIFREDALVTTIDRPKVSITIDEKKLFGKKFAYGFPDLISAKAEHMTINPENPDAVGVIEKIALQHGTVIPGFGETLDFYAITLEFVNNKKAVIHRTKDKDEADGIVGLVLRYAGKGNA